MTRPKARVRIQWTATALEALRALPKKVRKGILDKADQLAEVDDPKTVHKPLTGPLQGYFRLCYARYRAIYRVDEDHLVNGDTLVSIEVLFVAAGKRDERSRDDVYKVVEKIVELGLIELPVKQEDSDDD